MICILKSNILDESGVLKEKETDKIFATGERVYIIEDADGKIIKTEYTNNGGTRCILENVYDTCGNLIRTKDRTNDTTYDIIYDKYGRVIEKIVTSNDKVIKVANTYNNDDSIAETSFEIDGVRKTSTNKYTERVFDRKLIGIDLSNDLTEDITYDKLNRKKSTNIGGILSKNLSYLTKGDRTSNLISAEWFGVNGVIKDNLTYKYDVKGNITAVKENGIEIVRYTYDGIDRLIREDNKKLNKTTTYFYDEGGNLTDKYEYAYTLTDTEKLIGGERISYGYSDEGWRDLLLDYNGELCEYNELGNPLIYRGKSLSWTKGRCLTTYDNAFYSYNASGIRTQKIVNGVTTNFYLDGNKILAQGMYNPNTGETLNVVYTYGSDGVCGFEYDNKKFLYKKNIFGDILSIYNEQGVEIVKYIYDAWGNHKSYYLSNGTFVECDNILTTTTEENKLLAYLNPFRYRGYYFDIETGLYYLQTRYYDPEIGRFINADDISYLDPETLNGLNLFAYCGNNPVINIDSNGNEWWKFWEWDWESIGKIALGAVVAIGMGVASIFTGGTASIILGGAALGSVIGFFSGGISGLVAGDGLKGFANGALSGAITGALSGAIAASPLKAGGQIIANIVCNVGNYALNQALSGSNITLGGLITSTVLGATLGIIGGPGWLSGKSIVGLKSILKTAVSTFVIGIFGGGVYARISKYFNPEGNFIGV